MAEFIFYAGTMDCGKSTLALQMDHNHATRGRSGIVFTRLDRAGHSVLSSRLGLEVAAVEVEPDFNIRDYITELLVQGQRIDYLICDEAQFYAPEQVDDLAFLVDELDIDVYAFGIMTDFRTKLFPGSARLIEVADRVQYLQVEALCWCGSRALHNARTVNGLVTTDGDQVLVGDVSGTDVISYEVLCRRHYRLKLTAKNSQLDLRNQMNLPFVDSVNPQN